MVKFSFLTMNYKWIFIKGTLIILQVTIASMVSVHCTDHIMMLINDIKSRSTLVLASSLTDTVSPNSPPTLKNWPEMNFKSDPRHTLELYVNVM